jgi:predicted ATP-grasp superfamily ATP-dependent carboligase
MQILLYEYVTGGGLWSDDGASTKLLAEARAMVTALSEDLSRIPGVNLICFEDSRFSSAGATPGQVISIQDAADEWEQLARWAPRADGTLLIAPETGRRLLERSLLVACNGGRLLSPDPEFVMLAGHKPSAAERLNRRGVRTPPAITVSSGEPLPQSFPLPAVLKPCDGAGSVNTQLVRVGDAVVWPVGRGQTMRLEQYCAGTPASVSVLCGPAGSHLLPGGRQRVSHDGRFQYLGGELPLEEALLRRSHRLAADAVAALPSTTGYIGIDMILGPETSGSADYVVEINPRLTTSYVALRELSRSNLAEAMLHIARGKDVALCFQSGVVQFDADGRLS